MGDAWKGKRLQIASAVVVLVMAGVGAAAQAGLLSRAEVSDTHSRGAGAAIADPEGNGDVIAVAETEATREDGGNNSASATLLRVGDTKIGEAPEGYSSPLSTLLNGQPTEAIVDAGCDGPIFPPAPLCVGLLQSSVSSDNLGSSGATMIVAQVGSPLGYFAVFGSHAGQNECPGSDVAVGGVVINLIDPASSVDLSQANGPQCEIDTAQ